MKLLKNAIVIFLILLLTSLLVEAQELAYRNFTIADGLPSNTVYDICQDDEGYMWFATENGLSRYDGEHFKNFTIMDGLPDTEVLSFFKDSRKRIWFSTLNGKIGYLEKGKFHNGENTEFLKGISIENVIYDIGEDKNNNLYFSSFKFCLKISPDLEVQKKRIDRSANELLEDKNGNLYIRNLFPKDTFTTLSLFDFIETKLPKSQFTIASQLKLRSTTDSINITKIFGIDQSISSPITENFSTNAIRIDDELWLGGITTPLQIFNIEGKKLSLKTRLDNLYTSRSFVDKNKNVWMGSIGKGAYLFRQSSNYNYKAGKDLKGEQLTSFYLDKSNGYIYVGSNQGLIDVISENGIINKKIQKKGIGYQRIRAIKKGKFGNIWVIGDSQTSIHKSKSLRTIKQNSFQGYLTPSPKGILLSETAEENYLATSGGVFPFQYNENAATRSTKIISERSTCLFKDNENTLWVGTTIGLCAIKNNNSIPPEEYLLKEEPITSINQVDSILIIGTNGKGIILLNGNKQRRLTAENGLASNLVRSIYVHSDHSVWVATNEGLSVIKSIEKSQPIFTTILEENGLVSNNVLDCDILDSSLYVLCPQGVSKLDLTSINFNWGAPQIDISQIMVNDEPIDMSNKSIQLNYSKNNISLDYNGIHYGNRSGIEYIYKLVGYHDEWQKTKSNHLIFEKLPPGKYTLELYASILNKKSERPELFTFEIIPAFHQRIWVQILAALLLALALAYFIRKIFEREHKKSKIENRLLQLEQIALQSQMNPHFIKNALGAIQHLMIKKDVRTANKYLITFGELITTMTRQANQSTINIAEEINMMELYLSIEKLRFDNNFEYSIDCVSDELMEERIPSMMIQPLVENSIIHGFRDINRNKANLLSVRLEAIDNYVICTIKDNGMGMKHQHLKQQRLVKKQGIGMSNIQERILLLSNKYPKAYFKIVETGEYGTVIELCLPREEM